MDRARELFIRQSQNLLLKDYLPKIERCLEVLPNADLWWRQNQASNSVGNLLLHLAGNLHQWIVAGVGGVEDNRQRAQEFSADGGNDAAALLEELRSTVQQAVQVLHELEQDLLEQSRTIQGIQITTLGAIYHAVEHFSMHVGQIIYITKLRTGRDLEFYTIGEDGAVQRGWCST
ncbi:MAG: DUF1572 family protein [Bacteroidetes bacterium]|nr:DUF1572 family protein [Bacteroidota bacterium]